MFRHAEPRHTRSQRLQPGVFHVITRRSRLFLFTIISARTETSVGPRSSVLGPARPGEAMADLCTKAKKAIQEYIDKADNGNCWGAIFNDLWARVLVSWVCLDVLWLGACPAGMGVRLPPLPSRPIHDSVKMAPNFPGVPRRYNRHRDLQHDGLL